MLQDGQSAEGGVTSVTRIGNTVRRSTGRWTPAVHSLLRHLEAVGLSGVPRVLGFDEMGREVLSFIPGETARRPWPETMLEEEGLAEVALFLRRYHSALKDFEPPEDAEWRVPQLTWRPGMTIRHGDIGPWNTVWEGRTLKGVIDWDFAEPGDPIGDVSQFAWYGVPLRGDDYWTKAGFSEKPDLRARLLALSEAYGAEPKTILDTLIDLQLEDHRRIGTLGAKGIHPWALFYERGDLTEISEGNDWLRENYDSLAV